MIRINLLYILLVSFVIFIIAFSSLDNSKIELKQQTAELNKIIVLTNQYNYLQKTWSQKRILKKIKNLAKLSKLKNISYMDKKNQLTITIVNENFHKIDKFINKISN